MQLYKGMIDKNVPIPLYYQLKQILLAKIKNNEYKENEAIPTELELSIIFDISRPTIRQAIKELENEGYLYRRKGKGTFVSKTKIFQEFTKIISSFDNEIMKKGMIPKTKVLQQIIENASIEICNSLQIPENSKIIKLKRLRFANEEPIVVVDTYIPYSSFTDFINIDYNTNSLYETFEKKGIHIKRVKRIFEAIKASTKVAEMLNIEKGNPVHQFETIAYIENDIPVEYSLSSYRGDMNKFVIEINRK